MTGEASKLKQSYNSQSLHLSVQFTQQWHEKGNHTASPTRQM